MAMRETASEDLEDMCGEFSRVLLDSVELGVLFFDEWMPNHPFDGEEWGIAPLLIYRSVLEKLDGAAVLAEKSCPEALAIILRTVLEGTFGLEYMLQDRRVERSLSYLYFAWNEYRKDRKDLDGVDEEPLSVTYEPVEEELKRVKEAVKRTPSWYSLFPSQGHSSPYNIYELASVLGRKDHYGHLYRPLSKFVHNATPERYAMPTPDGTTLITGLRFPTGLQELTTVGVELSITATRLIVTSYAPDHLDEFNRRVSEDVKPGLDWLKGPRRITVD